MAHNMQRPVLLVPSKFLLSDYNGRIMHTFVIILLSHACILPICIMHIFLTKAPHASYPSCSPGTLWFTEVSWTTQKTNACHLIGCLSTPCRCKWFHHPVGTIYIYLSYRHTSIVIIIEFCSKFPNPLLSPFQSVCAFSSTANSVLCE